MKNNTPQFTKKESSVYDSLIDQFKSIPDHRSDKGKRFSLPLLLSIILLGFIKGKRSVETCAKFAKMRENWFSHWFDVEHGIPVATTINRALKVTVPQDVIKAVNKFVKTTQGVKIEKGISIDGKAIKAISNLKEGINHFISLFSHNTCRILDQEGVVKKENEITATPRMLSRHSLIGSMITGDALLTQTRITKSIRETGADYLLIVKGNHPELQAIFTPTFHDPLTKITSKTLKENRRTRKIETIISLTQDLDFEELKERGWKDISLVGKLERSGVRINKRSQTSMKETIFFISSRSNLNPQEAYSFLRNHWHIENKLHWQKDVTWGEDRQRSKVGNTPSILSYFRSFALECIRSKHNSITTAINQFTEQPRTYKRLLTQLKIV